MSNEITRWGAPYDNYAFKSLCLEMSIWGTAEAALCAVFWRKAEAERNATTAGEIIRLQALLDTANMTIAGQAAELESIGAGGVSALLPGHGATPTPMTEDAINNVIGNWFAEDWAIKNARGMLRDLGIGKA